MSRFGLNPVNFRCLSRALLILQLVSLSASISLKIWASKDLFCSNNQILDRLNDLNHLSRDLIASLSVFYFFFFPSPSALSP